jgi:hypothetical protein
VNNVQCTAARHPRSPVSRVRGSGASPAVTYIHHPSRHALTSLLLLNFPQIRALHLKSSENSSSLRGWLPSLCEERCHEFKVREYLYALGSAGRRWRGWRRAGRSRGRLRIHLIASVMVSNFARRPNCSSHRVNFILLSSSYHESIRLFCSKILTARA